MDLKEIALSPDENYVENSEKFLIVPGKKYNLSTKVKGIKGKLFCGYFGAVILNNKDREIARRIIWFNDYSAKPKNLEVIFLSPQNASNAIIIYRINQEVPVKSDCHFHILPIDKIKLNEAQKNAPENYLEPADYSLPRLRELSDDEESALEKNLVWIFAAPRSGTSWLGPQLLSYHTLSMNEPQIGLHLGMRQPRIRESIVRQIDLFKNEPDYFFSKQYEKTWKFFVRKLILNRIYAQFQDLSKKIVIKEPNGTMGADVLAQILPHSKIILVIRDGRDVIDSMLDALKKGSWATKAYGFTPISPKKRLAEVRYQANLWVRLIQMITSTYENHSRDLLLLVKYEDLMKNTKSELQKIYDFIQIDIPKGELEKIVEKYSFENISNSEKGHGKVTRSATPGKWRENFSEEEKKILEEIMGRTLQKLEYS